jgi:hypothetical protein
MEKARLPSPAEHPSFQKHRRQLWTQILTPLLIAAAILLAVAALTGVATFRDNGEVERWAAISTIWIVIPVMGAGLLALLIFLGLIYGMARLLTLIPPYTGYAQKIAWRIEGYVKRGTELAVKPVLALEEIIASLKRLTGLK